MTFDDFKRFPMEATVRGREVPRKKVSGQSTEKEWICIRSEWDWMAVKRERLHLRMKRGLP